MAQLLVTVVEGRNIKRKDLFTQSDPFVQIYLDDRHVKAKTQVKHNSKNPQWDQTLTLNHLHGQDVLHIDVCDEDRFHDDRIGSTQIDLHELYEKRRIEGWYEIHSRFHSSPRGEIRLILEYQPLRV